VKKDYTVLQSAGLSGTRFDSLQTINLPNFIADVGYSSTDVTLDLTAAMPTGSLPRNLQGLAGLLDNSFNSNGVLPAGPAALYGATGEALNSALSQATGESATGAEESAFQLTNEFLSLLLDPFVDGRDSASDTAASGNEMPALAYAAAAAPSSAEMALANIKGPTFAPIYVPRWNAWASGFGGTSWTGGTAAIGTHSVSAQTYGSAAGVDYHATPDTFIGFALAGAGLGWNLADRVGGGNGTSLQAGVYGATQRGPIYVAGAASFAEHWLATKRDSFTGDQLTANFGAQSYGGRLEAGYRIPASFIAAGRFTLSPYAAIQAQDFHTPSYSETDSAGGGFGLSYTGADAGDTRSELGARFDTYTRLDNGMGLDLRARAAWAHDWVGTPTLDAAFEVLPGGSFIVNGATPPHNSALLSTGAELHVTPALSVLIKFDGALADSSDTYAGTATLRYAW
jgi:outer membrane autotransporter protein